MDESLRSKTGQVPMANRKLDIRSSFGPASLILSALFGVAFSTEMTILGQPDSVEKTNAITMDGIAFTESCSPPMGIHHPSSISGTSSCQRT
jgi:hypothetical protein